MYYGNEILTVSTETELNAVGNGSRQVSTTAMTKVITEQVFATMKNAL